MIMIGWNIVFQRMQSIVSIAFLFRREAEHEKFGHIVFSKTSYDNWKNAANRGFPEHCRAVNGRHNKARKCADDFSNQRTSIARKFESNSIDAEKRYEV
jgi:hypothetical protein